MFELMRKDLIAARWLLVILVPFYVLQLAAFSSSASMFFLTTFIFSALLGFGSVGMDDYENTETLWCSLPVARSQVVLGRYLSAVIGMITGLVLSWLTGVMVRAIGAGGSDQVLSHGPWTQVSIFAMMALLAAVFLPCYFRFGAGKGLLVFSALAVGALILLSLAIPLTLLLAGQASLLTDAARLREMAAKISDAEREQMVQTVTAFLAVLSLVLLLFSSGLSVRFYDRRDL